MKTQFDRLKMPALAALIAALAVQALPANINDPLDPASIVTWRVTGPAGGAAISRPAIFPSPNASSGGTVDADNVSGQAAFLSVVLPKQELYVGERVPVQVRAYFRAGMDASLNGFPALSSDALTLGKIDGQPEQSQVMVNGRPYTLLTWSSALTAVKAGDYEVNLQLPVLVREHQRSQGGDDPFKQFFGNSPFGTPPFDNSFFNDPDFDDFFGTVIEQPITLRTDDQSVSVLPLPVAGRPANFNGAVGRFEVSSEASPTQLTVGDPITLRLNVSGEGNFDRVYSSGLDSSADWKTYPPGAKFDPADSTGCSGTKTFEQAVIPLKAGSEKIPALTFSYFDPDSRKYVTQTATPIGIEVAPGGSSPAVTMSAASSPAIASTSVNLSVPKFAPNDVEAGTLISNLQPVLFKPWFIASQGLPVMALAAIFYFQKRRQQMAQDPRRQLDLAAHAALRAQLAAMEQALANNSAPAFFTAARQAVRTELARHWRLSPGQVNAAEITRRLNGDAAELRNLFAIADAVVYSGEAVPPAVLQRWKNIVMHQLKKLEEP